MSMPGEGLVTVARDLEQVFSHGTAAGLSEGQLLRRFASGRDEAAFSALVARHGPMVLGVCRRVLGTVPDADDAFQATFLVLVRRAGMLQDADSLGPWLHGVAWRVASRARADKTRRAVQEQEAAIATAAAKPRGIDLEGQAAGRELRAVLDEEIHRLPEKYRRPVVLCYVEGLSQEDAARRLRCKAGVLRGRLERARLRLRGRLVRRGVAPAATATVAVAELIGPPAHAAVPSALLTATLAAAGRDLTVGKVAGAVAVSSAVKLAGEFLRRQLLARCAVAAVLLATGTLGLAAPVPARRSAVRGPGTRNGRRGMSETSKEFKDSRCRCR